MKPLDWLRAKAAAAVRIGPGPLGEPAADLDRVAPLAVAAIDEPGYTEQPTLTSVALSEVEQALRQRLAALSVAPPDTRPRAKTEAESRCTCAVIYSRCYPNNHRTTAADFRAELRR